MRSLLVATFGASVATAALIKQQFVDLRTEFSIAHSWPRWPPWKPLVTPNQLMNKITLSDLVAGSQKLQDIAYDTEDKNRVFGSQGHNDTVDYIYNELVATGYYHVWKQHQKHIWSRSSQSLHVNNKPITALTMTYSPSTNVTAPVILVSNAGCSRDDYPKNVSGNLALIIRGECSFGDKAALAGAANAAGALIYNNANDELSGTLGSLDNPLGPYAPTVGISKADGKALTSKANTGINVNLWVLTEMENRTTFNVLAQTKGGDPHNVVMLGAHSDSVEAGPGINDDGSGTISNLQIAKVLAHFSVKNAVRFGFWTAEEYGLLGSTFYTESLSDVAASQIALYLNFDMTASPNYVNAIFDGDGSSFNLTGPPGSGEIEALLQTFYDERGLPHVPSEFDGRSDYQGFILRGIPAGGIDTGAEGIKTEEEARLFGGIAGVAYDKNYHGKGDTINNLAKDAYLLNAHASAFAVAKYAVSTDDLPERDSGIEIEGVNKLREVWKWKGHKYGGKTVFMI